MTTDEGTIGLAAAREVQKILVQTLLIKDHLLKVLIHHRQESPDQEITVQDLMINTTIIID